MWRTLTQVSSWCQRKLGRADLVMYDKICPIFFMKLNKTRTSVTSRRNLWHWFQLEIFRDPLLNEYTIVITFKCVSRILFKILWYALTNFLFVNFFQWRYHVTLWFKKCVFCLYLTLHKGKRLFLISVFNVFFKRTLKNSIINSFSCMFFQQQQNVLLTTKLFWLCLLTFSDFV